MATKQIGWLIALLVATPGLYVACGGDDSSGTTSTGTATGGAAGTGGSTTTGGSSGSGGATGGSAGTAGTGGSGGSAGSTDGGVPDGRIPCGTLMNGCNPDSNTQGVCDAPNNRCVECLTNDHCADETNDKICDLRPTGTNMLPRARCVACVQDSDCPMGATCSQTGNTLGQCYMPCGTTTNGCNTNPTGNNICDAPNNRCVDCMNDGDCAVETVNKHCDTSVSPTTMLPRYACEECLDNSHCMANEVCVDNNCEPSCTTDADCATDGGGGGRTPYCHPTTHVCSQCGSDAHCSGNTPYCSPQGDCEQCLTDAHCTQAPRVLCNPNNYSCVECVTSDQCTPPQTCGRGGTCTGGVGDGGGMPPMPEGGGGGG